MGEIFVYGLMTLFFSVMLLYGWTTTNVFMGDESVRIYPSIVLGVIVICIASHCIYKYKSLSKDSEKKNLIESLGLHNRGTWRLIGTIAVTIMYFALLDVIGFTLITPFICVYYMFILGERKWHKLILISLGIVLSVYAVFTYGLEIRLPRGIGVFREFSLYLEYLF